MRVYNDASVKTKRQDLRKRQTDAEIRLWQKLRRKQFLGIRFHRQFSIGQYIADFYAPGLRIVIEVDGGQHYSDDGRQYDRERALFFESLKIRMIRFSNLEVLKEMDSALRKIESLINGSSMSVERNSP